MSAAFAATVPPASNDQPIEERATVHAAMVQRS